MRNIILLFSGGSTLLLFACLVAPAEPAATSESALSCGRSERAFNGACRKTCSSSADCDGATSCMKVSPDVALCLDYRHCAYLGSDTACAAGTGSYGYGPYTDEAYGYYGGGGSGNAGSATCAGDATWQVVAPSGDPSCGASHPVQRCARVAGQCRIVSGATVDVADP